MSKKIMAEPITVTYVWIYNEPFGYKKISYTATTHEDYQRIMKILEQNEDKLRIVSVAKKGGNK